MEYCCHVWAGAPSCYLELLGKLQKRICRTVSPSLAASLEPLVRPWNVASLILCYRYYFGGCSSELAQLVPLPFFFVGGLLVFFVKRFPVSFNLFVLLLLVTPCLVVAVQPCIEWIPIKKMLNCCSYTSKLSQLSKRFKR